MDIIINSRFMTPKCQKMMLIIARIAHKAVLWTHQIQVNYLNTSRIQVAMHSKGSFYVTYIIFL